MNTKTTTTAETVAAGLAAEDAAAADFAARHDAAAFTLADAEHTFLGKTVRSSYGTGPYLVTAVDGPCTCEEYLASLEGDKTPSEPHIHLVCRREGDKEDSFLGGYRLDGTNVWGDDQLTIEEAAPAHRTSIKVGDKYYPARISEALTAMPDWREEPEYERLCASAGRDQNFQQPVLGKLVIAGSKAMPVQYFEIEDGRHRFWAAEENKLAFIEGKVTEMPVAELMLRSLLERRHLTQGARAYLAWPVIAPFVEANKEARAERGKANLKRGKEKGEAPRNRTSTVSGEETLSAPENDRLSEAEEKTLREMAASYGISETLLSQAQRVHALFARRKDLKAENEAAILAGDLGMGAFLAGVAGKDATEGKERKNADPLTLLQRGFKDLTVRFSKWEAIPDDLRRTAANQAVDHVLTSWPPDVREKLKLALA